MLPHVAGLAAGCQYCYLLSGASSEEQPAPSCEHLHCRETFSDAHECCFHQWARAFLDTTGGCGCVKQCIRGCRLGLESGMRSPASSMAPSTPYEAIAATARVKKGRRHPVPPGGGFSARTSSRGHEAGEIGENGTAGLAKSSARKPASKGGGVAGGAEVEYKTAMYSWAAVGSSQSRQGKGST